MGGAGDKNRRPRCSEQNRRKAATQSYGATAMEDRNARRAASFKGIDSRGLAAFLRPGLVQKPFRRFDRCRVEPSYEGREILRWNATNVTPTSCSSTFTIFPGANP